MRNTFTHDKEFLQIVSANCIFLNQEEETVAGTDGTFGRTRLFSCAAKHAVFVHLHRVSKDNRFAESSHLLVRTTSHS